MSNLVNAFTLVSLSLAIGSLALAQWRMLNLIKKMAVAEFQLAERVRNLEFKENLDALRKR